jgi:hypothetical protein
MKTLKQIPGKLRGTLCAALVVAAPLASALEVAPGDFEAYPAGATIAVQYLQFAKTDKLQHDGKQIARDFELRSTVGIFRLLHVVKLSENAFIDPQFLLPFGRIEGHGTADALGTTSGFGDLILTVPLKLVLNDARDVFSVAPYLIVPTGNYDRHDALNLGENRLRAILQTAYVKHFDDHWAIDLVGDATFFGDNDDYGATGARLEQAVRYEGQVHLRYHVSAATHVGLSLGAVTGGETKLDGVRSDDALDTRYARLSFTSFVTPSTQLQVQLGRDLDVRNGAAEEARLNLRLAHVF